MEKTRKNRKIWLGVAIPVILAAAMVMIYFVAGPKTAAGSKTVTIEVVSSDNTETAYVVSTDAEYLRQVMEEADGLTFSGDESGDFGMMVLEVNGEVADYMVNGAYWSFYVNGEYCNYGIETQPVQDGDVFGIVYTLAGNDAQ